MTSRDQHTLSPNANNTDSQLERVIRPRTLDEYVGQTPVVENLRVFIEAAKMRGDVLDHTLIFSPPGLGKTTLGNIIANELNVSLHSSSGPAIDKKGDLAGPLTNLKRGDVLFIDEIHRLNPVIEENLYPAMEDYCFDIITGEGPAARNIKLPIQPFSLIGATTRAGMLTSPLRDRFGIIIELSYYSPDELVQIVRRNSKILNIAIEDKAAWEIARRSRGTPRITNRLLRRVRDFANVAKEKSITLKIARFALEKLCIDEEGLDQSDQKILNTIVHMFNGGPVGQNTLCAALSMERESLEDVYEPYLIQQGYIQRTPKGRVATLRCYQHLGIAPPTGQPSLFPYTSSDENGFESNND